MAYRFTSDAYHTSALPIGIASNETTFTMACWFKAADITNSHFLMSIADTAKDDNNHFLGAMGGTAGDPVRVFSNQGGGTNGTADTSTGFSANTWHHACGVWNGAASRTAYLDAGGKITNTNSVTPTSMDAVGIGALWDLTPNYAADVTIAEAAIWDVALTDAEVAALATGVSPLMVRPGGLVFYVPLVRNVIDVVGGLSLSTSGAPVISEHTRVFMPRPSIYVPTPSAVAASSIPVFVNHYRNQGIM